MLTLIGLLLLFPSKPVEPPEAPPRLLTYEQVQTLVYASADLYGANKGELLDTVLCEAPKVKMNGLILYDTQGQSSYITKDGTREDSWGLAQWNLPANNKKENGEVMTKEDAMDTKIALDTMAFYFLQGLQKKWSCWAGSSKSETT